MRPALKGSTALVTGASSGIGRELALQIAPSLAKGCVVLVARRAERLEELAVELRSLNPELKVLVAPADLADRESTDAMLAKVEAEAGSVDILVNNAGMGDIGLFEFSDWSKLETMIQLNVTALTYLSHRLVPGMKTKGQGGILNISSGFGLQTLPGAASYAGTKHYVSAFTEALRQELRGHNIVVTQVCPGPVATEFEAVAGNPTGLAVPGLVELSAAQCARSALRGFLRGRAVVVPGFIIGSLVSLGALAPRWLLSLLYWPVPGYLRARQQG